MAGFDTDTTTAVVLLDLAVVVTAGGLFARMARRFGQPPVIGEILAGITLGPSLLGLLPGDLSLRLFPTEGRPFLQVLANVGVVLFMFVVGHEVDLEHVRKTRSAVAVVGLSSVLLPLAMGVGAGLLLYSSHRDGMADHVDKPAFVLFFGVTMAVTAFPVLARILTDMDLQRSRLGNFTMMCAALTDVVAWALLALAVLLAAGGSWAEIALRSTGLLLFLAVLVLVVRPLMRRLLMTAPVRRPGSRAPLLMVMVGLLLSAWTTARLGFHPIFGAFAFGAATPREALRTVAPETPFLIEHTGKLLLPIFFVTTGLRFDVTGIGASGAAQLALALAIACAGKFVGAAGAARLTGMDGRRATAVGVLMNCRGLTELVVIETGVSAGVLDQQLATVLIIMAVVTTAITAPLFRRVYDEPLRLEDQLPKPAAVR